jgi:hypothetical protein
MGVRRWMFFHPNDGVTAYPNNPDCDNYLLWERISDLENYVETLRTRNTDLTQELEQYQGRIMVGDENRLFERIQQLEDHNVRLQQENTQLFLENRRLTNR